MNHIQPLFLIFCFGLTFIGLMFQRRHTFLVVGLSLLVSLLLELVRAIETTGGHIHSKDAIEFLHAAHYISGALLLGMIASTVVMIVNQKRQQSLDQLDPIE